MSHESLNPSIEFSRPGVPSAAATAGRVLALLLVLLSTAGCDDVAGPDDDAQISDWTGRYVTSARNLAWASQRDLTSSEFGAAFNDYAGRGYIIINTGARNVGGTVRYGMVWRENVDGRGWSQERHLTPAQYQQKDGDMEAQGFRPLDVEGYQLDGALRFSGIWIQNREELEWWSELDMTSPEYEQRSEDQEAAGLRPIDLEIYPTSSGPRIAAIWNENVHDLDWIQRPHMTREEYQQEVDQQSAAGYRMIDFEAYEVLGDTYYAAIWEKPAESFAAAVRTNRTSLGFANLWRQYRDEGYRIVDLEQYEVSGSERFGGIWIENADRFRYQHKAALNNAVSSYQQNQGPSGAIPGLSVVIIQDGDVVYRRGFGNADVDAGKVAHSQTVYSAASVSKVIGGTLAARLEAEDQLQDGTPVDLNLADSTKVYLPSIPSHHDHTLEQLTAHLGCVGHYQCGNNPGGYCTYPGTSDAEMRATHYRLTQGAASAMWNTALIDSVFFTNSGIVVGCTIGSDRRYSTPGFTLLGAAMEVSTGMPLDDLLERELAVPFGLTSMRAQFAQAALPANYERALPYDSSGTETIYTNSSWKVLGGGIEVNTLDLARFGWMVLDAEIVDEPTRETRLWAPVCTTSGGGACMNGIAWVLGTDVPGRRFADHGGSWSGAASHLRVYRDDGLVIAVMSNQRRHNPSALVGQLANIILP
jgi:CubicO group peptidase (beta-lactamase class C family)